MDADKAVRPDRFSPLRGIFEYEPGPSRLLVRVWRALASGKPVTAGQVADFATEVGLSIGDADQFLRQMTERDVKDNIVGAMGLSLNDHPHRFVVDGVELATWCAEDTLFLPAMLGKPASVASESPLSTRAIRIEVGPEGIRSCDPAQAVISIVSPQEADMSSAAAIAMTFCHHIFFFSSRVEAEEWAGDRDDIEILSLDEGYALGQELWGGVLSHARAGPAGLSW